MHLEINCYQCMIKYTSLILLSKKLWKNSILKYLPVCEQTWFAIFNESFISEETRYSKSNSKWKEIRTSEETSYNVLFYFQVLENSHNLLTTIKANVLAIYNPKHCRKRKKVTRKFSNVKRTQKRNKIHITVINLWHTW